MVKAAVAVPPAADADTETRILDAAHAVFLRAGTAGARMQEIADEAGVNKALLHYYFRNKERLASAVFERVAKGLFARLGAAAAADVDLETKVRTIIGVYLDAFAASPFAPGYLICEMNQHPERAEQLLAALASPTPRARAGGPTLPGLATFAKQIEAQVAAGAIRSIAPRQFIANLVSLCVLPFAARPLLCAVLGMDDRAFRSFIEERKATLADTFLASLKP